MARTLGSTVENNFVNGHITEATALNFPESACIETQNCVFHPKGNVTRRLGFDLEADAVQSTVSVPNKSVNSYYWSSAAGFGIYNFAVMQVGLILYIYSDEDDSLSGGYKASIDLTSKVLVGAVEPEKKDCQFASGKGYLFVTHPNMEPLYVKYDPDLDSFSTSDIIIKIRDTKGIDDGEVTDNRHDQGVVPTGFSLDGASGVTSKEHTYNLYNQGWVPFLVGGYSDMGIFTAQATTTFPTPFYAGDPLRTWLEGRDDVPSNADVWWIFKDSNEIFQPKLANSKLRGSSRAPRGRYLLEAFNQDRSAAVAPILPGMPVTSSGVDRPSSVAFFAGRVFYSGINHIDYSNKIYYSQVVKDAEEFPKCYQENDPTSEEAFSILATDGGEIQILEAGTIYKVFAIQNALLIFASNGMWSITGSTGTGFTPTDYTISRVTSVPSISHRSFIDIGGIPVWWNDDGIYTMSGANSVTGQMSVASLTEKKNKTHYITIPEENKRYARGSYNAVTKVIQWLYRRAPIENFTHRYEFDSILCFNTITQAFYNFTIPNHFAKIVGLVCVKNKSLFKYFTFFSFLFGDRIVFSEENRADFKDFASLDGGIGAEAEAYFVSGYKVHGDGQKNWQSNYIFLYCDNLTINNFHFQSVWDYATDGNTGDYGTKQIVTWDPVARGYKVIRLKIRGMGKVLQYKVTSIPGKWFNIVGWSASESTNARV